MFRPTEHDVIADRVEMFQSCAILTIVVGECRLEETLKAIASIGLVMTPVDHISW